MRFEVWQAFIDELVTLLLSIKTHTGAMIVWRTTFMVSERSTKRVAECQSLL
jgi:hypothetical protein